MAKSINYFLNNYTTLKDKNGIVRFHEVDCNTQLHYVLNSNNRMFSICSHWGYGAYDNNGDVIEENKVSADAYCNALELNMEEEKYELYELNPNLSYH